ncbi:MAG: type II toxin-antitoxin system VapC family toxin [Acidimicrobiaceae bacterium]|nr:type II toxin-antitoxin system VapC family toxin [Acidimicrobiaceae bacterium]
MTLYADSSALLKRYVDEPDSEKSNELLESDPQVLTARLTIVEVRRNLYRLLDPEAAIDACINFVKDMEAIAIIELDAATCELAAMIAEQTNARTLDALHLAAAKRIGPTVSFLTFDVRQADVARRIGLHAIP